MEIPLLFNYIHKVQGLDKSIPICLDFKKRYNTNIITILDIEDKAQNAQLGVYWELLQACGSHIIVINDNYEIDNKNIKYIIPKKIMSLYPIEKIINKYSTGYERKKLKDYLHTIIESYKFRPLLLTIYNGIHTPTGKTVSQIIRANNGVRLGYLKSLHDQGIGLTDLNGNSINLTQNVKMKPFLDFFLVPKHDGFRNMLAKKGVHKNRQIVSGYPICYPAWHDAISNTTYVKEFNKHRKKLEVVLFTRGQVKHKDASLQIISDQWLLKAIEQIIELFDKSEFDFRIRIKPHPYQDESIIRAHFNNIKQLEITYEPPSVLAHTSDLAIATYSSAILDAVALGIPSIEYYKESDVFKKLHPDGSPFINHGVLKARTYEEFKKIVNQIINKKQNKYQLGNDFGDVFDYCALEYIINNNLS